MSILGLEPSSSVGLLIGCVLLLVLLYVFFRDPEIRGARFLLLGFFCALAAGFLGFLVFGKFTSEHGIQVSGGMGMFVVVLVFWRGNRGEGASKRAVGVAQGVTGAGVTPPFGHTDETLQTMAAQSQSESQSQAKPERPSKPQSESVLSFLLPALQARRGDRSLLLAKRTIRVGRWSILILIAMIAGTLSLAWLPRPEPGITITELPPYDPAGGPDSRAHIAGKVTGVNCIEVRVLVYAHTNGWYLQPIVGSEWIQVGSDCTWDAFIHTGDTYAVMLVKPTPEFTPEIHPVTLPRAGPNVLATVVFQGKH